MAFKNKQIISYSKKEIAELANIYDRLANGRVIYTPLIRILTKGLLWRKVKRGYTSKQVKSDEETYQEMVKKSRRSMTDLTFLVCVRRMSSVRKVMFEEPLESMPLYINDKYLSHLAKYRLKLRR